MKNFFKLGVALLLIFLLLNSNLYATVKILNIIDHPNIIYINVDDLGWRDLGNMGSTYYETLNIDQLSKEGMTLHRATRLRQIGLKVGIAL